MRIASMGNHTTVGSGPRLPSSLRSRYASMRRRTPGCSLVPAAAIAALRIDLACARAFPSDSSDSAATATQGREYRPLPHPPAPPQRYHRGLLGFLARLTAARSGRPRLHPSCSPGLPCVRPEVHVHHTSTCARSPLRTRSRYAGRGNRTIDVPDRPVRRACFVVNEGAVNRK